MSFGLSSDETQIAQNLGDLSGYLGQRGYQDASIPINPDGTIGRVAGEGTIMGAPGGYPTYAAQGVGAPGMPQGMVPQPVMPQPQPQIQRTIDPAEFEAIQQYALGLEEVAQRAAQEALIQEEQNFLLKIRELPEEDQIIAWQKRQIDQLTQANTGLSTRLGTVEQQAYEEEQQYYKEVVAEELCRRNGINFASPQVERAFMAAQSREDMDNLVDVLTAGRRSVPLPPPGSTVFAPQTPAQRGAGLVAAAGRGQAGPQAIKPGSGDLKGYLKAKGGYQVTYVE